MRDSQAPRPEEATPVTRLRFGVFEMDLATGELRRSGVVVKFPPQPFQLLSLLARHPGEVLSREQIQKALWKDGTNVDFDQRLNSCINQIRHVLGDDADVPRWVETLPRRGYRWLAPTEFARDAAEGPTLSVVPFPFERAQAEPPARAARPRTRGPALAWLHLAITAALAAALAFVLLVRRPAAPLPSWRRLTFDRGFVSAARFTPTGEVLYSGSFVSGRGRVFTANPSSPDARPVDIPGASLAVGWSPEGEIAFLSGMTLARGPAAGGARKNVLAGVFAADMLPDGKGYAVVRYADGGGYRAELPVGHVVGRTNTVSDFRVSPDGTKVALVEHPVPMDDAGLVVVLDRDGRRRELTPRFSSIAGLAWSARGDEVWFTAAETGTNLSLQAVDLAGRRRVILPGNARLVLHDIDRAGRVLLDSGSLRVGVQFGRPEQPERDLSWLDATSGIALTPDGRFILLGESGEGGGPDYSTYYRPTDGGPAVRLGSGHPLDLSSDGRFALVTPPRGPTRLELLPIGAGETREIRDPDVRQYDWAGFVPGTNDLLVTARVGDRAPMTYRRSLAPGPLTPLGGDDPFTLRNNTVSPDGERLARPCTAGWCLEPLDGSRPPQPIPGSQGVRVLWWDADQRHLYVRRPSAVPAVVERLDLASGKTAPWRELSPPDMGGVRLVTRVVGTPDGRAYAYTYVRQLSELFVVDGLR